MLDDLDDFNDLDDTDESIIDDDDAEISGIKSKENRDKFDADSMDAFEADRDSLMSGFGESSGVSGRNKDNGSGVFGRNRFGLKESGWEEFGKNDVEIAVGENRGVSGWKKFGLKESDWSGVGRKKEGDCRVCAHESFWSWFGKKEDALRSSLGGGTLGLKKGSGDVGFDDSSRARIFSQDALLSVLLISIIW